MRIVGTQKNFTAGSLQTTNNPLDLAVNGRGFFQVTQPDGTIAYSRDGTFHLDANGQIVTANGYALEPAIVVPQNAQTFTVGQDGTVSVTLAGATATPQIIGNIQTADFINPAGLQAMGGNLYTKPVRAARRRSALLALTAWVRPCRTPWKTPTSAPLRNWST